MQNNTENKEILSQTEKLEYYLLVCFGEILNFLGFSFVRGMGAFGGFLMWYCMPKRRRLAVNNIRRSLNVSTKKARVIARKSFSSNAKSFLEITLVKSFSTHPLRSNFYVKNPEILQKMQNTDRPIVSSSAHLGAWELISSIMPEVLGSSRPALVVVRQYPNHGVQKFILRCREAKGAKIIGHRLAAMNVLRALKQKGIVGFLVDHHARKHEAIYADFFGQKTAVNLGPALLALRGEALVFPAFLIREKDGYTIHLDDCLDTKELTGTREEKVRAIVEFYTQAVERIVRKYPEQWFWMHNRWKD